MDSPPVKGEIREKTTFCEDCDRYFSSKFSLKRHRRVVHGSLAAPYQLSSNQRGGGLEPHDSDSSDIEGSNQPAKVSVSGDTSGDEVSDGSDSDNEVPIGLGRNTEVPDDSGSDIESDSSGTSGSSSDSEDTDSENGPQFNKYDVIVGDHLIKLMKLTDASEDEKLRFVREFYTLHSHFLKSNLKKVLKNAISHFSEQLELMSKSESIKAGIALRRSFIFALFKRCNASFCEMSE